MHPLLHPVTPWWLEVEGGVDSMHGLLERTDTEEASGLSWILISALNQSFVSSFSSLQEAQISCNCALFPQSSASFQTYATMTTLCFVGSSVPFEGICGRKEDSQGFFPLNISNEVTKDLKTNVSCCLCLKVFYRWRLLYGDCSFDWNGCWRTVWIP